MKTTWTEILRGILTTRRDAAVSAGKPNSPITLTEILAIATAAGQTGSATGCYTERAILSLRKMVESGEARAVTMAGEPDLYRLATDREIAARKDAPAAVQKRACCPLCQRMIVVGDRGTFVLHGYKDMGLSASRFNGTQCKGTGQKPVQAA